MRSKIVAEIEKIIDELHVDWFSSSPEETSEAILVVFSKAVAHAVAEERDRVIEEIEGILNPLWKGTLNYASRYRYKNINSDREDLEEIESVITKLVLYLTKHYHEKNNKDRR